MVKQSQVQRAEEGGERRRLWRAWGRSLATGRGWLMSWGQRETLLPAESVSFRAS